MQTLSDVHPDDRFQPFMKVYCVNIETGELVPASKQTDIQPGDAPPKGLKIQYVPRIRCNDCPGKVYTAVRESVVEDFGVHLRNKKHKEAVLKARADEREGSRPRESRR
jgi:SWI/SNF-related matrix-associated actin-dependent regulator of chromatin subfamily B protein 1